MKGFVAKIFIVAFVLVSSMVIVNNISAVIEESRTTQAVTDARQVLKTLDTVVNQLAFEGEGAKRSIDVNIPEGKFIFSGKDDKIKIRIENTNLLKPGARIEDENIIIQGGGSLSLYETDVLNDGQPDYVMENSAVLVAIKKLGNATDHVPINTSSIFTVIRNKRQDINMTLARTGIFINEKLSSSWGMGFTEMTELVNAQTGSIIVHMNATNNVTYDAVFTLAAATDYFTLEVRNVAVP